MRAPALRSAVKAASNARATAGSTPSSTMVCGTASRSPSTGKAGRSAAGSPARTASSTAQQATVAANGPTESSEVESGNAPLVGTRCAVGLNPTMPHNAAGMRHEPPVSVPSAPNAMPSVTDTAAPEDEPPGMRAAARSWGLSGVP